MSRGAPVAVLSLACRFPEADGPEALWRNVLEGRRAFRPIPPARLPLAEYDEAAVGRADSIPRVLAGLISDWAFSREAFFVPRGVFETADLTHWLTLDVASRAIADVGGAEALPRARTAVVVGNTLTGEFTRSGQVRLRAPYLARRLAPALAARGVAPEAAAEIVADFVDAIRADFPEPNEETLAGALANTIAGRVANHFDLHGGAWTVDGACASSLLAIADACGRLAEGAIDAAIVGGVDLSLDPFELVGFARAGALATDAMRVFDRRASGFWPGEGCGVVVLATAQTAARIGVEPIAWIEGWGVSTDGAGGLTRPTVAGQRLALERAWRRAGRAPAEAGLFEAHGTGTAVGDPTEIRALADLIAAEGARIPVGSIKGNVGHCKAAAGMAGFIKAALAVRDGIVPPHVGCEDPHPVFADTGHRLAPASTRAWEGPRHAGVSGFGFGGVNTHVALSSTGPRRAGAAPRPPRLQDAELFVFAGDTPEALVARLAALRTRAPTLSLAELTDAAHDATQAADPSAPVRAAVVAAGVAELVTALDDEIARLRQGPEATSRPPRIGLLFPGQAAPARPSGGAWARRFPEDAALLGRLPGTASEGAVATDVAQPAIVAASLFGAAILARAGVTAEIAAGHSLGELSAIAWAGGCDPAACVDLAAERGAVMAAHGAAGGAMARVGLDADGAARLAAEHGLAVACLNARDETVLAGPTAAIDRLVDAGAGERLRVSHAFHSPDMAPAAPAFAAALDRAPLRACPRPLVSTVLGRRVAPGDDLHATLVRQLTAPVRFTEALAALAPEVDVLVEVGPGAGLTRLAEAAGLRCLAVDACAGTLRGLLGTLAALWRLGAPVDARVLFADRATRPLSRAAPSFLANPCGADGPEEDAPGADLRGRPTRAAPPPEATATAPLPTAAGAEDALEIVRGVVAEELGLPVASVATTARLLDDLHLNSLSVGRIVNAAARRIGVTAPAAATDLSGATVAAVAEHLRDLRALGGGDAPRADDRVEGVAPWIAEYATVWTAAPRPGPGTPAPRWSVVGPRPEAAAALPLAEASDDPVAALIFLTDADGPPLGAAAATALWRRAKAARAAGARRLAVVHHGVAASGFARSLALEGAFEAITLIDMAGCPADAPDRWQDVAALLSAPAEGLAEWRLGADGALSRPALRLCPERSGAPPTLGASDVALVAGGARGIGAECALHLAAAHGLRLALAGRSDPGAPAVAETMARAAALGVAARYRQVDVADPEAVRAAVAGFAADGFDPSVLIHAAGDNRPAAFDDLEEADLARTLAPKLDGLEALLAALDPARLRLAVCFGSIIGALGLAGESHYALANDMTSARLTDWGRGRPVRVLALDWSIWAGAGMGERLGAVERLRAQGVDAVPLDGALRRFDELASDPDASGRRIVTGRFGPPRHVRFDAPPPPPLRFVETPRVLFPGVELVADARLAPGSDPWLEDHVVDGAPVVPAVMLLEAAAQAVQALTGATPAGFASVRFARPVIAPAAGVTLRTAALADGEGRVRVVFRASDDAFAEDRASMVALREAPPMAFGTLDARGAWPAACLYDSLFFNRGRFRRLETLERVSATSMRALIGPPATAPWFGAYAPQTLLLGDPAARDAGLHALQACAPQRRVLPVSVTGVALRDAEAPRVAVEAREVRSTADSFVFDIQWRDADGRVVETWRGAEFRSIAGRETTGLPDWMLPAILEREAALGCTRRDIRLAFEAGAVREVRRAAALDRLDVRAAVRRGDGARIDPSGRALSIAHGMDSVLTASGDGPVAVDLVDAGAPVIAALSEADARLAERLATAGGWSPEAAAAAVWSAREALRKAGAPAGAQLSLETARADAARLRGGGLCVVSVRRAGDGCAALAFDTAPARAGAPALTPDPAFAPPRG